MAILKSLRVLGASSGDQAAALPAEFVRKQEFDAGSGIAPHHHDPSDIDGLVSFLVALLDVTMQDTNSIEWLESGTAAQVRRKANGGILEDAEGLYIDSGTVSLPGHHHVSSDITDLAAALYTRLKSLWKSSETIEWIFDDAGESGTGQVRLKPAGGLLADADGVYVDLGPGATQAASGTHSHEGLHDAVTVEPSDTILITLNGQDLALEAKLSSGGGLTVVADGLAVDFGSGTGQVARGDHSHALLHDPVTTVGDASLALSVDADQVLSGTVRRDPAPGGGGGKIGVNSNGLYVVLGTASAEAAAGDHGHDSAAEDTSGFMSAQDKTRLDTLWGERGSGTLPDSGTMDVLTLRRLVLVNPNTGQIRTIYLGDDGEIKGV